MEEESPALREESLDAFFDRLKPALAEWIKKVRVFFEEIPFSPPDDQPKT